MPYFERAYITEEHTAYIGDKYFRFERRTLPHGLVHVTAYEWDPHRAFGWVVRHEFNNF